MQSHLNIIYTLKKLRSEARQVAMQWSALGRKKIDESSLSHATQVEVCMGMGKTGIPWVPWDSHGNGNEISHGIGMGWEWELSAWEWELRRGVGIVFCE